MATGSMRKLLRTGGILTPGDAGDAGKKRAGSEWCVVGSGRRRAAACRRGRNFEIWAGTGATMGKGSAGVREKESRKQRMVEFRVRTAIRSSERRRGEEDEFTGSKAIPVKGKSAPRAARKVFFLRQDFLPAFVFHATGWTVMCCCVKLLTRTEALCETIHNRARQIPPAEHFF